MKILIPDWKCFGLEDMKEALENAGHAVVLYKPEPRNFRMDPKYKSELKAQCKAQMIDVIFSFNYYPIISDACHELKIPYLSWCYDSPLILTYSKTIFHPCNYIFLFDSQMVADLKALGAEQVYYLPMAVNAKRLEQLSASPEDAKILETDVSFVGSMYTEKHNLYDKLEGLDEHTKGYLDGIMHVQKMVYGRDVLQDALTPEILQRLQEEVPLQTHRDGLESPAYVYVSYFLCRSLTRMERRETLQAVSGLLSEMELPDRKPRPLRLYTPQPTPFLSEVENKGPIQYQNEMPLAFKHSKINLNISLRSIQNGIPLRAMDIMGAGGFLLTNYQADFERHFIPDEDYVYYGSREELLDKVRYYLEHEEERARIAESGCRKVRELHTYAHRIREMFEIAGL